jgi:hypothetical protein
VIDFPALMIGKADGMAMCDGDQVAWHSAGTPK